MVLLKLSSQSSYAIFYTACFASVTGVYRKQPIVDKVVSLERLSLSIKKKCTQNALWDPVLVRYRCINYNEFRICSKHNF